MALGGSSGRARPPPRMGNVAGGTGVLRCLGRQPVAVAVSLAWARANLCWQGCAEAMASLTRRTEMRTSAPTFSRASRMVPQVASANWVWANSLYRTRLSGQWVALRGAPEGLLEPCGAGVERAAMAVLLDQPFGVVANEEGADGVADLVDGLEDASMHDLLLQRSEQAPDHSIRFRLSDEGVARRRRSSAKA